MNTQETLQDVKQDFEKYFNALPDAEKKELVDYYGCYTLNGMYRNIKEKAQRVIDYADRQGYGYGEVYYNLNEYAKEAEEEFAGIERPYKNLIHAYFELLVEAIEL